jgi:hypothetical protein
MAITNNANPIANLEFLRISKLEIFIFTYLPVILLLKIIRSDDIYL